MSEHINNHTPHIYKHTPGPWKVQGGCEIVSPDGLSQGGQLYDIGGHR